MLCRLFPIIYANPLSSLWLRQACAVFQHNHHTAGSAPELKVIFYRLARLFRMTTTVIVVYDGDKRPKFKRGKVVGTTPHWLTKSVRQLVELFGFINHTVNYIIRIL